jgi:hypothetical protein
VARPFSLPFLVVVDYAWQPHRLVPLNSGVPATAGNGSRFVHHSSTIAVSTNDLAKLHEWYGEVELGASIQHQCTSYLFRRAPAGCKDPVAHDSFLLSSPMAAAHTPSLRFHPLPAQMDAGSDLP